VKKTVHHRSKIRGRKLVDIVSWKVSGYRGTELTLYTNDTIGFIRFDFMPSDINVPYSHELDTFGKITTTHIVSTNVYDFKSHVDVDFLHTFQLNGRFVRVNKNSQSTFLYITYCNGLILSLKRIYLLFEHFRLIQKKG